MQNWCESSYAHPKAKAVLKYISKGNVIKDLIDEQVLVVNDKGKLMDKWDKTRYKSVPNGKQDEASIRFIVWETGNKQASVWDDASLQKSWIEYYASSRDNFELCYISGVKENVAEQHPRFIRASNDNAKLISSGKTKDKKSGTIKVDEPTKFTYTGRFTSANQVCGISFEGSQKAHFALKWLVDRQGTVFYEKTKKGRIPGLTVVAWATSGQDVPSPINDSIDFLNLSNLPSNNNLPVYTAQEFALKLNQKVAGYKSSIGNMSNIVVMALYSASPGRMSISFYRELYGSDFINKVENWHSTCCWEQEYYDYDTQRYKKFVGAPTPVVIAEAVYGKKLNDKLRKSTIERLLPCIIDGQKIPLDLVEAVIWRSCSRSSMKEQRDIRGESEWEKTLGVACALTRKYYIDYKREEIDMVLENDRISRDYLYGRLLAIADVIEQKALKKVGENRATNASKYMQRFAERPYSTWKSIELSLQPYITRLAGQGGYYQGQLDEVMSKFTVDHFTSDKKLNGEFLLGYHCQRKDLLTFSDGKKDK